MTLVRFPSNRRGYLFGAVAGLITCFGVTSAGRLLVHLGLHAELTYLDDGILGVLVALLVFLLHRHHEIERSEYQARIATLIALHQGIAGDLQVIASITGNSALAEIANEASARIDATIANLPCAEEFLPQPEARAVPRTQSRLA
jgi:hypothetical protein